MNIRRLKISKTCDHRLSASRQRRSAHEPNLVRRKVRIRFSKEGDLRHISHRDLMRALQRALRRAAIPIKMSEGFHPKPRMSFPLALGVGIIGSDEIMELELAESIPPDELRQRLSAEAPAGFYCKSVEVLNCKNKTRVRSIDYVVPIPPANRSLLPEQMDLLLKSTEWIVERERSAGCVAIDMRPRLLGLSFDGEQLHMRLKVTAEGSVRPEEVLRALNLGHLTADGAILTRTCVAIEP